MQYDAIHLPDNCRPTLCIRSALSAAAGVQVYEHNSREAIISSGVRSFPTFHFYRDGAKVDECRGANIQAVEQKAMQHKGSARFVVSVLQNRVPGSIVDFCVLCCTPFLFCVFTIILKYYLVRKESALSFVPDRHMVALVGAVGVVTVGHNAAQGVFGRSRFTQPGRPGWMLLAVLVFTFVTLCYLLRGVLEASGQTQYAPGRR